MWPTPADPNSGIGKDLHGLTDQTGGRAQCQSGWHNQGRSWHTKNPPVQQCNQFCQTSPVEIWASRQVLLAKMCEFHHHAELSPQNQIHMNGHVKLSLATFQESAGSSQPSLPPERRKEIRTENDDPSTQMWVGANYYNCLSNKLIDTILSTIFAHCVSNFGNSLNISSIFIIDILMILLILYNRVSLSYCLWI